MTPREFNGSLWLQLSFVQDKERRTDKSSLQIECPFVYSMELANPSRSRLTVTIAGRLIKPFSQESLSELCVSALALDRRSKLE